MYVFPRIYLEFILLEFSCLVPQAITYVPCDGIATYIPCDSIPMANTTAQMSKTTNATGTNAFPPAAREIDCNLT